MRKALALISLLGIAATTVAATGSSETDAILLKPTKTAQKVGVSLVPEGTNNVCYFKIIVSKGTPYTVWLSDVQKGATIHIDDVYSQLFGEGFEMGPTAQFESAECGDSVRWVFSGKEWVEDDPDWKGGGGGSDPWGGWNDWDDDDKKVPSSWPYYVVVTGLKGETATLNYQIGNVIPQGVEQNPLVLKPKEVEQATPKLSFLGQSYFCELAMKAGSRYHFKTSGGSSDNELYVTTSAGGIMHHLTAAAGNDNFSFAPYEDGTYKVWIESSQGNGATASLAYRVDASRKISEHPATAIVADKAVTCRPGHLNARNTGAYDAIIDEQLYKFSAAKDVNYLVFTEGAATDLALRIYDAKGNILVSNKGDGKAYDVRGAISADKAAVYYIGVCENLGSDDDILNPTYQPVQLMVRTVALADDLIPLAPVIGQGGVDVRTKDPEGCVAPVALGGDCWAHVYTIAARKGVSYELRSSWCTANASKKLTAEVYTVSGKKESVVAVGELTPGAEIALSFKAAANDVHYIRVMADAGKGIEIPDYRVHAMGYTESGSSLGSLKVELKGTDDASWMLNSEKAKYVSGDSMLLPAGKYTIKFNAVKGFGTPASETVNIIGGQKTEIEKYYGDTFDPKDDTTAKATSWTLKNEETEKTAQSRTLWKTDPADVFAISGKDGYLYDFSLVQEGDQDAVFSISGTDVNNVTSARQIALPTSKAKYYLTVTHRDGKKPGNTSYTLNGHFANVGAVKFSKAAMSVKDNATSVKLTVNRTAKDGQLRVKYFTMDGTAMANKQYVPQEGVLEWADKDNKAKTIEIKLIPKLLPLKTSNLLFYVQLADDGGEYPAPITVPTCTITVSNSGKYLDAKAAYAAADKTKKATTSDEKVPLRAGTYFGIVASEDAADGVSALASVTLTVAAKDANDPSKDVISAKVALAGKTYAFKTEKGESPWDEGVPGEVFRKRLLLAQKVDKSVVTNVLEVVVNDGEPGNWKKAGLQDVRLTMSAPIAAEYAGKLCRQNAKVNDYLDKAYRFDGYYTVSLVPGEVPVGLPAGNGYLTVTVDNKGGAKIAGLLADNTKVSVSATACGIVESGSSQLGYEMFVPVYLAKSPYCFGGWIVLTAKADANRPDGKKYKIVADLKQSWLLWNNDNASLTYDGKAGWRTPLMPVGGWYDKVVNLQAYYNDWAQKFGIETLRAEGFPKEDLPAGYTFVTEPKAQLDGMEVNLAGDKIETDKKSLVKRADNKSLIDWDQSVNPCNVQVKLARATGIVTGSCSVWAQNGTAHKEITGYKHYGVITLDRDDGAGEFLSDDVISAGFLNKSVKVGKRNWVFSVPFCLMADPQRD